MCVMCVMYAILQEGWSCLHAACAGGHVRVIQLLCECGGKALVQLEDKVALAPSPSQCVASLERPRRLHLLPVNTSSHQHPQNSLSESPGRGGAASCIVFTTRKQGCVLNMLPTLHAESTRPCFVECLQAHACVAWREVPRHLHLHLTLILCIGLYRHNVHVSTIRLLHVQ
jgi:hypothetical protein